MIDSAVTAAGAACGFEDALTGEVLRWMDAVSLPLQDLQNNNRKALSMPW